MTKTRHTAESMAPGRKIRWITILGAIMLSMLLVAAATFAWLASNPNRVQRVIEDSITEISGRPFSIEGKFDFELGRQIILRAHKVRWRNAAFSKSRDMLEIDEFTATIDLFSLLGGPVVIADARATDAVLRFEWQEEENSFNWALGNKDKQAPRNLEQPHPLPLVLSKASVNNVRLYFQHPALTDELEVVVKEALHKQDPLSRLVVSAQAVLDNRQLTIDGHIGPLPELVVAGAVDFAVLVKGELAEFAASGRFSQLAQLRDPKLKARLAAVSASNLAHRLKLPLETHGNVQLDADLSTAGDAIVTAVNGSFGEYQIAARLQSDTPFSLQGLDVSLESSGPSIADLAHIAGFPNLPDAPFEFDVRARQTERGIDLQQLRLNTADMHVDASGFVHTAKGLRDADLQLAASGSDFTAMAQLLGLDIHAPIPFDIDATIVGNGQGQNDTLNTRLRLGETTVSLDGSINEQDDFSGSRLRLGVDAPDASQLATIAGIALPPGAGMKIQGAIIISEDKIALENLQGSMDGTDLAGTAWVDRKSVQPRVYFEGGVKGGDFADIGDFLLPSTMVPILPKQPFKTNLEIHLESGVMGISSANTRIGTSDLSFSGKSDLNQPDLNFTGRLATNSGSLAELFAGTAIDNMPGSTFTLKTGLRVSPAEVRLTDLKYKGKHATIGGELSFATEGYAHIDFDLTGHWSNLRKLIPRSAFYHPPLVPFDIAVRGRTDLKTLSVEHLSGRMGDIRLEGSGALQIEPTIVAKGVKLTGTGPSLADLGEFGSRRFKDRPFRITGSVEGGGHFPVVEDMRFESGKNNLSGRFSYNLESKTPSIVLVLRSSYLDLDEIREPLYTQSSTKNVSDDETRLFSKEPLPFDLLDLFNAEVDLNIDHLITHERSWRNLAVEASLNQSSLKITRAQVVAAEGTLKASGTMKPTPAGRSVTADIEAAHAMIALQDMSSAEIHQLPHHAVAAHLSASGNTPHELAASLDGFVWVIGGQGLVRRSALGPIAGDFMAELAAKIAPTKAKKKEYAQLDCQGVYFEIANGKIETAPAVVIQTEHAVTMLKGAIDLPSEKINLDVETTPRKGIGVSLGDFANPFIKIAGTLKNPRIVLDPKDTLTEGAAAVVTSGLSILAKSMWKRWYGTKRICEKVGDEAVKIRNKRDPEYRIDLKQLIVGTQKPGR